MENKVYSLEKIIDKVKSSNRTDTKALNGIFIDMIGAVGITADMLKTNTNRYKFSDLGVDYWVKALSQYTMSPYKDLREARYDKLSLDFIREFMDMVIDTMNNADKSSDEIEVALQRIDDTTSYTEYLYETEFKDIFSNFCKAYRIQLHLRTFLLVQDRREISEYVKEKFLSEYFDQVLQKTDSIVEFFEDERLGEAQECSTNTESQITEAIMESDASVLKSIETDECIRKEAQKISKAEENGTKGMNSKRIHAVNEIYRRKNILQKEVDESYGLKTGERKDYNLARHRPSKDILKDALEEFGE